MVVIRNQNREDAAQKKSRPNNPSSTLPAQITVLFNVPWRDH